MIFNMPVYAGWTPAERISDEATVYHPRIASNGDYLHVVYSVDTGGDDLVYYTRSTDTGQSWSDPYLMVDTSEASGAIFPIVRTNGDSALALWRNYYNIGNNRNLSFRRSLDNGQTWQPVTYILSSNNYEFQKHAFCVSGRKIFVIFSHYDGDLIYEFVKSANGGQTWSEPVELFRAYQSGWIDMVCRGDTIHFIWSGNYALHDSWETFYTRSINAGETWSENLLLTEPDTIGSQHPSLSINESGNLAVCWTDGKYSPNPWNGDLFVRYSYDSGVNWTEEEQITFTHWARVPRILWKGDSIHVTWEDGRYGISDPLYMLSPNNGFDWEQEQLIDNDPDESDYPDIALTDSCKHVVWTDFRDYDQGRGVYYTRGEPEVSIEEDIPEDYEIELTAYPNPFNSTTSISYSNLEGGDIEIYDIMGRLVKKLHTGGGKEGEVNWDATDASGENVSSGIYFARARSKDNCTTEKLIYLK